MKFVKVNSPFLRKSSSVNRMMIDVIIAIMPLTIFVLIVNGLTALRVIMVSIATMMAAEGLFILLRRRKNKDIKYTLTNVLTPIISGIIYALLLPPKTSTYVVIAGSLFGIVIGKLVFGGTGANIFNPAGVARVFTAVCFPLADSELYNASSYYDLVAGATPLSNLKGNFSGVYGYSLSDLFLGFAPGSMGEVSKLFILIGAIYLIIRKSADFRVIVASIVSFFGLALVAGLAYNIKHDSNFNAFEFALYELLTGGIVFGAVFMLTDPVTGPISKIGRINYAIIVSIITLLIRLFGAYSEGCVFALLIGNMIVPVIDYYKIMNSAKGVKAIIVPACLIAAAILVIAFAM